ncbi:DMT family transporter [Tolumonas lignilytica]|uniref:DMT family transporter n=1 Tax=Tolumonas lignilytica TaxID=1283284 RepID=UPI00046346F6|nr:EamA family transporter [Tolumonas lignilytica]
MNSLLYLSTVLIWGTTWIALKWQLGVTAIPFSIAGRFLLAAFLLLAYQTIRGKLTFPKGKVLHLILLQGVLLFCCNFLCFYNASYWIPSGLIAVIFSTSTLWNALCGRFLMGRQIQPKVWQGGIMGLVGLVFLFWPEITSHAASFEVLKGLGLALLGTLFFSSGNMISARLQALGATPIQTNGWAMLVGATVLLVGSLVSGLSFNFDPSMRYWGALVYLAFFGSVIGFTAYLMLVGRIGPEKAAYSTVLFPVVALNISVWFEGYQWTASGLFGLFLVMAGNVLVFYPKSGNWRKNKAIADA